MRSNLIEFRKKLGLTQEEFGLLFHKSKQYIWFVEKGKRQGSAEMWMLLAIKFDLSLEELKKLMEVKSIENA